MSVRVLRGRLSFGTCSKWSGKCRYAIGEVSLVSGLVRRILFKVATCPARSVLCRYMSGDVGLVSEIVRQSRFSVGTCSARSD